MLGSNKRLMLVAALGILTPAMAVHADTVPVEYYTVGILSGFSSAATNTTTNEIDGSTNVATSSVTIKSGLASKATLTFTSDHDSGLLDETSGVLEGPIDLGTFSWNHDTGLVPDVLPSTAEFTLDIFQIDPVSGSASLVGDMSGQIALINLLNHTTLSISSWTPSSVQIPVAGTPNVVYTPNTFSIDRGISELSDKTYDLTGNLLATAGSNLADGPLPAPLPPSAVGGLVLTGLMAAGKLRRRSA